MSTDDGGVPNPSSKVDIKRQSCQESTIPNPEMGSNESTCAENQKSFHLPTPDQEAITRLEEIVNDEEDSATESLPPTEEILEEPHDRSDGSDSGLGSELSEIRSGTESVQKLNTKK